MIGMKEINEEVFYAMDVIPQVSRNEVEFLKSKAGTNKRKRARLCAHRDVNDPLHDMLIVLSRGIYIRPKKYSKKSKSYNLIEGSLKVVIFDDFGGISKVIEMGDFLSKKIFFFRIPEGFFYSIVPITEFAVFQETTNGPFRPQDTIFASWAPEEVNMEMREKFQSDLCSQLLLMEQKKCKKIKN